MVDKRTGLKPKTKKTEPKKGTEEKQVKREEIVVETVSTESPPESKVEVEEITTAKAGKRSAKAKKATEDKEAKEHRKTAARTEAAKPKPPIKPPRNREERVGKKYRQAAKLIDKSRVYAPSEAIELVSKTSPTKFDSTVELHVNLAVDPKQADHNIRGTVALPAGTGKKARVAVFAEGSDANTATKAGADKVGGENFLADLDKGIIDFDVLITSPAMMPRLAKYARLLGPKGLMPNPKSGTVTTDIPKAVSEAKAGRLEYRVDSNGILHMPIGKVSFGSQKLQSNFDAIMSSVRAAKPGSIKGIYIKSAYLTSTMGPSIKLET